MLNQDGMTVISGRPGKKRRREKHRSRYSPEPLGSSQGSCRPHKRKRKHKSMDSPVSSGTTNTSSTSISDNEPRQPLKICVSIFLYELYFVVNFNLRSIFFF